MFKNEVDFNPIESAFDNARIGGQQEFWKRYKKLDDKAKAQILYKTGDLENAFQHAYTAARIIGFGTNKEVVRYLGYMKEIFTGWKEIKNNGKTNAYLDTNRDLWNNDAGIKYAIKGKKQGKTSDEIADDIFNQIIKKDSDFIVDFKNDKRRWDKSSNENNLWNHVNKQFIPKPIKQGAKAIKNMINGNLSKSKPTITSFATPSTYTNDSPTNNQSNSNFPSKYINFDGISYNGKKWKDWSENEKIGFLEGFTGVSLASIDNKKKGHWTDKFNIGNPDKDKGHWVTLDNGKHLLKINNLKKICFFTMENPASFCGFFKAFVQSICNAKKMH